MCVISVIDWGLLQNKKYRKAYYKIGEIVQIHFLLFGEHVWIEQDKGCNSYRVAFGLHPKCTDLVSEDLAMLAMTEHFQNLINRGMS